MPQPFSWLKLANAGAVNVSPRSGHTITATNYGFILYGGMDGRRNDQGNPSPNSDLYLLKLVSKGCYEWSVIELDPASGIPPARTLHAATSTSGDEVVIFGGIHSATPYQCLNDGWLLDTETMEWKRIQFKASVTAQKGSFSRRMTGLISERPIPNISLSTPGARRNSGSKITRSQISFAELAGAAASFRQSATKKNQGGAPAGGARAAHQSGGTQKSWQNLLKSKMSGAARASMGSGALGGGGEGAGDKMHGFHNDLVNVVSQGFSGGADDAGK